MIRSWLLLVGGCLLLAALASCAPQSDEKKFAPSYCLRFKLNCQSEEKKKHVCCLYPLPEGDAAEAADSRPAEEGTSAAGGVRIRPIRLPQREKVSAAEEEEAAEKANDSVKRPATDVRRNSNAGSATAVAGKKAPSSSSAAASSAAPTPPQKRPRICIRLVVNCNSSPDHRCCKYSDDEEAADEVGKEEEKPEEKKPQEPVPDEVVEEPEEEEEAVEEVVKPAVEVEDEPLEEGK